MTRLIGRHMEVIGFYLNSTEGLPDRRQEWLATVNLKEIEGSSVFIFDRFSFSCMRQHRNIAQGLKQEMVGQS